MNLKIRFALLYTIFVSCILLVSFIGVYYFIKHIREEEYFQGLVKEGQEVFEIVSEFSKKDSLTAYHIVDEVHQKKPAFDHVLILDSTGLVMFRYPDTLNIGNLKNDLSELKKEKYIKGINQDEQQFESIYMPDSKNFVIVTGRDLIGSLSLAQIRSILFYVFIGAILLSAILSFLFVKKSVKPLQLLSNQIQKINLQNLSEKVKETGNKDEINSIAKSFNALLERLSKSFEFQKNFVYHASHELRTPLAIMQSQTETALAKQLTVQEHVDLLKSLAEEQQQLIELTNSLLTISQYEHMVFVDNWPLLRIDEIIMDSISNAYVAHPKINIDFSFEKIPEEESDLLIHGNESLLKSAFANLIKNAYNYSIDKKVTIILETEADSIYIHFENNGTQLHTDEKDKIMMPFFRGANALTSKGYGLGLSLVYRFIAIHKGTVSYTPISNDSNRFTVALSIARFFQKRNS